MAKIALRSMIAGNIACFVTACIAGKSGQPKVPILAFSRISPLYSVDSFLNPPLAVWLSHSSPTDSLPPPLPPSLSPSLSPSLPPSLPPSLALSLPHSLIICSVIVLHFSYSRHSVPPRPAIVRRRSELYHRRIRF